MGTPHMGSDIVRWASLARKLLCFFPGVKLDSTMLSMLGQNSETLQNINTLFTGIASSFEIVYFYEEIETVLPTGQREVVSYILYKWFVRYVCKASGLMRENILVGIDCTIFIRSSYS